MEGIQEILQAINPADLDYSDWAKVGMAIKAEGLDVSVWDDWSSRDFARYKDGACAKKWSSFNGDAVSGGTLYHMAKERGYQQPAKTFKALDWGDSVATKIIDTAWVSRDSIPRPETTPHNQIKDYLESLFENSECVGYCVDAMQRDDGKWQPASKGNPDRTAIELIDELARTSITGVFGDYETEAGVWVRVNPLDGKGASDVNITAYRHALVESDTQDLDYQYNVIQELQLPCAAIVTSGGKSIHAIVKIEAKDLAEYKERVDHLYKICEANGLDLDQQNKNPSRYSRLPGFQRGEQMQELISTNVGAKSWEAWLEHVEDETDTLPDIENLGSRVRQNKPLKPILIEGLVRQGHKLMLSGASKAGKSFALMQMAGAIAGGFKWLGLQCTKGKVLYINLEVDAESADERFRQICKLSGYSVDIFDDVDIWNLRGETEPLDQLTPKLIRRAKKQGYIAIIIDPIYKVLTGDENSASEMAFFCKQFDHLCKTLNTAIFYCHHHSKGAQGGKQSADRSSGSGVFGRDPDALLDLLQLDVDSDLRGVIIEKAVCDTVKAYMVDNGIDWNRYTDQSVVASNVMKEAHAALSVQQYDELRQVIVGVRLAASSSTAWRMESTLREFASLPVMNLFFNYPIHEIDKDHLLQMAVPIGETPKKKRPSPKDRQRKKDKENADQEAKPS